LNDDVNLISLATASPPHVVEQETVAERARAFLAERYRDFDRLYPVFRNSGIERRQTVMPLEWYLQDRTWPERTKAYLGGALELFIAAAELALERAGVRAGEVDTIVTVSSTGIATPSLEARAAARMGFRHNVARVPVFGLGCAGGVTGLSLAARLAKADPGSRVLMVCLELCTLAFRLDELSSANVVATALFGDGAAACVVSTAGDGIGVIGGAGEHTWPDTLEIMGWRVDPHGFGVIFDRSIPSFVVANIGEGMTEVLTTTGLACKDVDRFVCHPGGAKVLQALELALHFPQGTLRHERDVLADHGNMSAPTVLFVLERVLADKAASRLFLSALGPGFTLSGLSLTV